MAYGNDDQYEPDFWHDDLPDAAHDYRMSALKGFITGDWDNLDNEQRAYLRQVLPWLAVAACITFQISAVAIGWLIHFNNTHPH